MADPIATPDQDVGTSLPGSPGQKRKRTPEQGSPDSRRSKRGAPAAAMSTESISGNFMDSAEMASAAAAANVNVADFNALQAAAHESHHEAADPANASSTAAAALDYPNIHMNQSPEESYPASAQPGVDQEHHDDNTFATTELSHTPDPLLAHSHPPSQSPSVSSVPTSVSVSAPVTVPQPIPAMPSVPQMTQVAHVSPVPHVPQVSQVTQMAQVTAPITVGAAVPQPSQNGYGRVSQPGRPAVGSEEWHKIRKDNHKEVERRRRETINEGINELSKIVPGCEKNKGSILQRAVSFITQLKENEAQNIEKWTLEKLLTEQAIAELSASNDKLKQECENAYAEMEKWKRHCEANGLSPPKDETASTASTSAPASNSTAAVSTSNS